MGIGLGSLVPSSCERAQSRITRRCSLIATLAHPAWIVEGLEHLNFAATVAVPSGLAGRVLTETLLSAKGHLVISVRNSTAVDHPHHRAVRLRPSRGFVARGDARAAQLKARWEGGSVRFAGDGNRGLLESSAGAVCSRTERNPCAFPWKRRTMELHIWDVRRYPTFRRLQ